jgi:hypothetical protein
MDYPANEWRQKLGLEISFIESSNLKSVEDFREAILDVCQNTIQNLLDTHTAQIVERIEKERLGGEGRPIFVGANAVERMKVYNQALDQAIDIINDNK